MSVSVLVKNSCETVGEGPHWDESKQRLLYVDIYPGDVHVCDPVTGEDTKTKFGNPAYNLPYSLLLPYALTRENSVLTPYDILFTHIANKNVVFQMTQSAS